MSLKSMTRKKKRKRKKRKNIREQGKVNGYGREHPQPNSLRWNSTIVHLSRFYPHLRTHRPRHLSAHLSTHLSSHLSTTSKGSHLHLAPYQRIIPIPEPIPVLPVLPIACCDIPGCCPIDAAEISLIMLGPYPPWTTLLPVEPFVDHHCL